METTESVGEKTLPAPDAETPQANRETRRIELDRTNKAELQKILGADENDGRTNAELRRDILAREFPGEAGPEPKGAKKAEAPKQEVIPVFNPTGTFPTPQPEAIEPGQRTVSADQLPSLVDIDSPEARRALSGSLAAAPAGDEPALQTQRQWIGEVRNTKQQLEAQGKVMIYLPQQRPPKKPLPPETVQINDYTYQVPRGVQVAVPVEVARILHEAGKMDL